MIIITFQVFESIKKQRPDDLKKIVLVIGDCTLPELGIGEEYQNIIKNEVNAT